MLETFLGVSEDKDGFLREVVFSLRDCIGKKWFRFGLCLKVDLNELHRLENEGNNYEMCTSRMLFIWKKTYEKSATWDVIVTALRAIDETSLAQHLEDKHIPPERRVNSQPPVPGASSDAAAAGKGNDYEIIYDHCDSVVIIHWCMGKLLCICSHT